MAYIYRELLEKIKGKFSADRASGCILSGIVGCGKTTLVERLLEELRESHEIRRPFLVRPSFLVLLVKLSS